MKQCLVLILFLATAALAAEGVDGKWVAQESTPGQIRSLTLKSNGKQITGSVEGGQGEKAPISEGVIRGNEITFKVTRNTRKTDPAQDFKATFNGDQLTLTRMDRASRVRIFKRVP